MGLSGSRQGPLLGARGISRSWIGAKSLSLSGLRKCLFPTPGVDRTQCRQASCQILKVDPITSPASSQLVKMLVVKSDTAHPTVGHGIRLDRDERRTGQGRARLAPDVN